MERTDPRVQSALANGCYIRNRMTGEIKFRRVHGVDLLGIDWLEPDDVDIDKDTYTSLDSYGKDWALTLEEFEGLNLPEHNKYYLELDGEKVLELTPTEIPEPNTEIEEAVFKSILIQEVKDEFVNLVTNLNYQTGLVPLKPEELNELLTGRAPNNHHLYCWGSDLTKIYLGLQTAAEVLDKIIKNKNQNKK